MNLHIFDRIRPFRVLVSAIILSVSAAIATAQDKQLVLDEGVEPHSGVDQIYKDFSKAYQTLDSKLLAGLYTEDVAYLSPSQDIVTGNKAVFENFDGFFSRTRERGRTMEIAFRIVKREVQSGLGFDVGVFTLVYSEAGKEVGRSKGKFVVVTRKGMDGKWRFAVDGYSDLKK